MDVVFKKPKLDTTAWGEHFRTVLTLYPAVKAAPSDIEIESFKAHLQNINKNFGLSLYMNTRGKNVPTRVGPAPLGGYLSYQMAPTEGNFKVKCNVDLSKERNSNNVPIT